MRLNIRTNISTARILRQRGLGDSTEARQALAEIVKNYCDPYVPMSAGSAEHMKEQVDIATDGSKIIYSVPYAHYQYHGEVMAGRAPKQYTGEAIDYHGAPMRGKEWDKRMMADRKRDVVQAFDAYFRRGR